MILLAAFQPLDWAVLGGYFLLLAGSGAWLSRRRQAGTDDYFLARRSMPVWAVAASVVATALSAATFVGGPELSYKGDLTYLSANIGVLLAVLVVAFVFIPAFYRHNVATVYQLLEVRAGPGAKLAASWMFMIGRVLASGARIYIAALPAALILFDQPGPSHVLVGVGALVAVGIGYTLIGGVRSVIWSDVLQLAIFVLAAIAALVVLADRIPEGFGPLVEAMKNPGPGEPSKLTLLDPGVSGGSGEGASGGAGGPLGIEWDRPYTLLTAATGLILLNIAAYGTDQDMTQRMLTCRTPLKGGMSVIGSVMINIPVTLLFMLVGLGLWVFYQRPDLMGAAAPNYDPVASEYVFVDFILRELPAGLTGLLMAGLFAAGLSSVNSALNAMSSTLINDFYRPWRPGLGERHYLRAGRAAVVGWGLVLGLFACICVYWQRAEGEALIDFALGVMTFAYAGLAAVFLTVILTRRGSTASVIGALATGFLAILLLEWQPWTRLSWSSVNLAFPWQMLIGTSSAMAVCLLGRGESREERRTAGDEPRRHEGHEEDSEQL